MPNQDQLKIQAFDLTQELMALQATYQAKAEELEQLLQQINEQTTNTTNN